MFLTTTEQSFTKNVGSAWDKTYEKLEDWQQSIFSNIPNFIVAIFVFTVALFLSRIIYRVVVSLLYKTSLQDSAKNVIARMVSIGVIMLGIILVLVVLNLNGVLNTILAGAGVMGLAVGLALQGTLSNTFSGVVLSLVKNIRIGDWVSSNNFSGQIMDIDFRMTTIKDIDNNIVLIPNKLVLDSPIKNASLTPQRRLILTCGVGYESDLDKVKEIVLETVKKTVEYLVEEEEITFLYTSFGDSAIDFELRCMLNVSSGLLVAQQKSNLITALKKRFDEEGINIPFPIRTFKFEQ
ncbi:mechanosensitive ion channel [Riemerella anatipestifer]|uniref:mechanosensitive ion channel family protein n=1 Tax=Riemerella anatipestifer TaxID=34085 RepID=UPI001BDA442A|nr:mechanosensitive ion channel domain-containing protein [Riemerella anatipestifer]MBT0534547.1 mechanosensitive ion channel [Riemerella anatipestifer]MBT0540448.1 mechanosensitive ion channel [Riemerella anatipestifer]MBT0544286.1 mechanosensitive ion channel [Riemerella anatipestifer]MBT0546276.1 mechanosensitive ion channel [Riemerella anatipestifer]MBT0548189.1 mechanosensitive ion channel [Riemerella anatipestifer]